MARKKREPEEMPTTAEPEAKLKPIRLDLSEETHLYLRVVSAYQNKSMAQYAREIIDRVAKAEFEARKGK